MPSAKVLEEKKAKVAALKERIGAAVAGIVVDYKGITVEDDQIMKLKTVGDVVDYIAKAKG